MARRTLELSDEAWRQARRIAAWRDMTGPSALIEQLLLGKMSLMPDRPSAPSEPEPEHIRIMREIAEEDRVRAAVEEERIQPGDGDQGGGEPLRFDE